MKLSTLYVYIYMIYMYLFYMIHIKPKYFTISTAASPDFCFIIPTHGFLRLGLGEALLPAPSWFTPAVVPGHTG